jgi:hypothetical protein
MLITLVMFWNVVQNIATAIPGLSGDATSFVWALGWMKTALVDLHVNPFHTDYVYYPLGGATQLMWAVSLIALIAVPLESFLGLLAAHNVLYLAATIATAYGMYLLAEEVLKNSEARIQKPEFDKTTLPPYQTFLVLKFVLEQRRLASRVSPLACFTAGLVFAFAPLRLGYGLSYFNLFNTEFIPFFALFLLRATRTKTWRDAILAGVFFALNAYVDFQIAAFLAVFALIYAAYIAIADLRTARKAIIGWTVAGVIAVVIVAPMLFILADDFAREGGNYIRVYPLKYSADRSYDVISYFVPNAWSWLYQNVPLKIAGVNAPSHVDDVGALAPDRQSFVGYVVLALAVFATATQWRRSRLWFFTAIIFAILGLGPSLHILGNDVGIPLPYTIVHEIPILNNIRIPMRYGIMVMFALAMFVAIAIQNSVARSQNPEAQGHNYVLRFIFLFIPVFILLEYAIFPYPVQLTPIPSVYSEIAKQPGDFTVLEIPSIYWRSAAIVEAYQSIHGKRILRAYTNRIAPDLAEYFGTRGTPIVVRSLRLLEGQERGVLASYEIDEDRQVRDEVLRFYDLRYAVLHRDLLTENQARDIDKYLRDVLGARVIADDGVVIGYELPRVDAVPQSVKVDLRDNIGQMYAGRGWQFEYPKANWNGDFDFVWARGSQSEIYFQIDASQDRTMTWSADTESPQQVTILLNGEHVGQVTMTQAWKDYSIKLPARLLKSKMNVVTFQYAAELKETIGMTVIEIK